MKFRYMIESILIIQCKHTLISMFISMPLSLWCVVSLPLWCVISLLLCVMSVPLWSIMSLSLWCVVSLPLWSVIIKRIYNLVSHCLPCNSGHNVVNHAIGIMEAFSNVNTVAKLRTKLQEVESSCRCTYNGVGGVIM